MRSLLAILVIPLFAFAQSPIPTEFPADAVPALADDLRTRISGNVFKVKLADGTTWRLEYKANGYAFVDTSRGFRDTGKWRVEDSKLCADWQKAPSGCSETRIKGEAIYLKRISSGEVIAFLRE